MHYDIALQFVEKLLSNFRLNIRYLSSEPENLPLEPMDFTLRKLLDHTWSKERLLSVLADNCKDNVIYQLQDFLMCNYFLFRLPEIQHQPVYACIGPYISSAISSQDIYVLADRFHTTPDVLPHLEQYYQDIPLIADDNNLLTILYTFGEYLWGSLDAFSIQRVEHALPEINISTPSADYVSPEETLLNMQLLEERYELEARLMKAVATGQTHKAELALANMASRQLEQRTSNSLRNLKNYMFVLNTVLRLAAANGSVHPYHIDRISSQYARKIELLTSESAGQHLIKEMVRKYCLLVKNHSMKGYSLLIQKVITHIDYDLTADLSLKTQAELLNVNSSYLSTLFKKETGTTLTDYVNRKRIEHAIFLLNSTNMQIQAIAQYCGIPDVNYFTKMFKKQIGKTPKEYREGITSRF